MQTKSRTSNLLESYAEVQPILCKDIHYLRDRNDLSNNNSKFDNSTLALPTILALASGTADYNIQHSKIPMLLPPPIMPTLPYWREQYFLWIIANKTKVSCKLSKPSLYSFLFVYPCYAVVILSEVTCQ